MARGTGHTEFRYTGITLLTISTDLALGPLQVYLLNMAGQMPRRLRVSICCCGRSGQFRVPAQWLTPAHTS